MITLALSQPYLKMTTVVLDKISKRRRFLNVSAMIGFRKIGINMMTFKLIFWVVLVPTVLSGSETWVMSAKDKET